ncbi:tetratricopeptide repeat protein, partial [Pseudodesulfovibrio sp.]|nr:tetratricopeptide repeat protein [Pseudodesulfovibrio sp.]
MGVHQREREMKEIQEHYIKKSSCILLVVMALLVGAFIGNTVTMLYLAQSPTQQMTSQAPAPSGQPEAHTANPEALAQLEAEAAANPTNADGWIKLGNFCFDHNLPVQAVAAYERAVELKPMKIGVWSDLGVMYRRTKQFNKALEAFGQAAALDKNHIVSRFNMGIVYLHDLNDKEGALKAWKEVLALDPDAKTPSGQPVADLV